MALAHPAAPAREMTEWVDHVSRHARAQRPACRMT